MNTPSSRRSFLRTSATAAAAAPLLASFEERALAAREPEPVKKAPGPQAPANPMPCGIIGKVSISRLVCGGNLISGYAHSRDLIYVSELLKNYFSDDRILKTWAMCEEHGINTMVAFTGDRHAVDVYRKYRADGGRIQFLAQISPSADALEAGVREAVDAGAVGAFLVGNLGDLWTREGAVGRIGELLKIIRDHGLIAGVGGHELRTVQAVEAAGLAPDFYVKTLHATNYWSNRRPDQVKEVIDNYTADNYWCMDPDKTVAYMSELERPWIAYKVLAAGAIHPRAGFQFAFENGADFALVGMFDFQVEEDVAIARDIVRATLNRERAWMA